MDDRPEQRDESGRFAKGNPGGPGRPRGQREVLRRAVEGAVTPEHVSAIVRRQVRSALEGNLASAKFVVGYVCGKPVDAPAEAVPIDVELPRLRTAADCNRAIQGLIDAICQGAISNENAKLLMEAIQTQLRSIEVNELEERLVELEKATEVVEAKKGRRR